MDPLDDRLAGSVPVLHEDDDVRSEVASLVALTQAEARRTGNRRLRGSRAVAVGATALVLVGGAAAAATHISWQPWAQDPDGVMGFTLPSGAECEYRAGMFQAADPETEDEVRDWVRSHTLEEIADIPKALRSIRSEPTEYHREDGTIVLTGYGTDYYDADYEYYLAATQAIGDGIGEVVERFSPGSTFESAGQTRCTPDSVLDGPSYTRDSSWVK